MKISNWIYRLFFICYCTTLASISYGQKNTSFDFFGDTITLDTAAWNFVDFDAKTLTQKDIRAFYNAIEQQDMSGITQPILTYKKDHELNDWVFYQLIRKTAQQFSPKQSNYYRYTLYKWYLLTKCGYNARLAIFEDKILFYVQTDDNVYDIPFFVKNNKQFICLNYHDYGLINFDKDILQDVTIEIAGAQKPFSYKVTQLPDFKLNNQAEKQIEFTYDNKNYHFNIALNPEVQSIFKNYPVVDFEAYFNIPLSKATYNSLIPSLKNAVKDLSQKKGVDYLMKFTRNAFLYESDIEQFGKEKRFTPEQTLFSQYSDCDDRVALFFYLVKEIYDLPMVVMLYPTHVTVAVGFDVPVGETFVYKGKAYSVCDPTPQEKDMPIGQIAPKLKSVQYSIAYEYQPGK